MTLMPSREKISLWNNFARNKISRDITWTIGSFFILAISGIVINLIVTGCRDAEALGVFNLAYAIYITASQVAVWGIQYSVLRHTAYYEHDAKTRGLLLFTASVLTLGLGFLVAATLYLASPELGKLFNSPPTAALIRYASFGLLFFPLNKILVAYLNGLRHMRAFALLQAGRYLLVMAWVTGIALSSFSFALAGLGFLVAELTTVFAALFFIYRSEGNIGFRFDASWFKQHLTFGGKSLPAGLFSEMNSRIDVLLLGILLDERSVGIYSFAAMLVDGIYHVLAMVRVNFNPVLVNVLRDEKWFEGKRLLSKAKTIGFPIITLLSVLVIAAYVGFSIFVMPTKGLLEGWIPLLILLSALSLVSPFVPFDNLLVIGGHPTYQALQHLLVVFANIVLNLLLVPSLGLAGAAWGTAVSYVVGIGTLLLLSKHLIGWNLLTNRTPAPQPTPVA